MCCGDVAARERRMMWYGNPMSARWFFIITFASCADVIETEIRKRGIQISMCMSCCVLPRIKDSKLI